MIGTLLFLLGSVCWIGDAEAKPTVYVVPWKGEAFAVMVDGRVLLSVRYPEKQALRKSRAEEIARRLNGIFERPFREPPTFRVERKKDRVEAYCEGQLLFSVFQDEARYNHSNPLDLALLWLNGVQLEFYGANGKEMPAVTRVEGLASWCHVRFHGRHTAFGETHDSYAFTAAHRELPCGSVVLVTNLENGKRVIVRINDRGPWKKNRLVDLSLAAARVLGIERDGVEKVRLEVIPWKE
ncbi:MAG: septal ring lytic transglycosylase RlpA family protein [Candidatus Caldatribacteriaceae bacterium]